MGQTSTTGRSTPHSWGSQTELFISIRNAEKADIISIDEAGYLRDMVENIEWGLDRPVSCLRVCDAQQLRSWSAEKFRRLRVSLETKGLVINTMSSNGARFRSHSDAAGLDLTPFLIRQDEFADRAKSVQEELRRRGQISSALRHLRGKIRRALRHGAHLPKSLNTVWEDLPRRVSKMAIEALEDLLTQAQQLWKSLRAEPSHPTNLSDGPHKTDAQITDTHEYKYIRKEQSADEIDDDELAAKETMKAAIEMLQTACDAEPEMQEMAEAYTRERGFEGLVTFLTELAMLGGAPRDALMVARRRMKVQDFCGLCLIVWAKSPRNTAMPPAMQIRNPAAWVWSMGQKVEDGKANIAASLRGLRKYWLDPVPRCV